MTPETFFGSTDTGRIRDNNEDTFLAQAVDSGRFVLGCVIDGVGGYEGGEVAADIAKNTLVEKLRKIHDPLQQMKNAFITANDRIYEYRLSHPDRGSMACVLTLALADTEANQFYYAHVGDTRLYLFRDRSLVKVTKDHSFVGFLEDNQRISEQEAMQHPKRNEVNKALGYDPNMAAASDYIETGLSPFLPGDLLMLCSDGLTDLVDSATMTALLSAEGSLADKTKKLIRAANDAGGKDNITVVLVQNNNRPARQKATKPLQVKKKEAAPPVVKEREPEQRNPEPAKRSVNWPAILLGLLSLVLAVLLYRQWTGNKEKESPVAASEENKALNAAEQRLVDSINKRNTVILDSTWPQTILLSDTIFIVKDSLMIRGNGVRLQSDSSFNGAVFHIDSSCRYLLLQDLILQDFDIGMLAQNRSLQLRNVSFINCRIPVQYSFRLPDSSSWSGKLTDTLIFKRDSLFKQ